MPTFVGMTGVGGITVDCGVARGGGMMGGRGVTGGDRMTVGCGAARGCGMMMGCGVTGTGCVSAHASSPAAAHSATRANCA